MSIPDINDCKHSGKLARRPYLFEVDDISVCRLLVTVEGRRKTNCFNVIVVGDNAEACDLLEEGNTIAIDGQLARYVRETGREFHEYVFIEARSIRNSRTQGEAEPLEVQGGKQVSFEDLPSEVQILISERIAELTEQGL